MPEIQRTAEEWDALDRAADAEADVDVPNNAGSLHLLRERAAQADSAQARLAELQRENALLRSGVALDSQLGGLFVRALKTYEGEWTPESLRAEAQRYGVPLKGQAPAPAATAEQKRYAVRDDRLEGWGPR